MIKEIQNWLEEPAYFAGAELYEKYGSSQMLKDMFRGSSDSYNKKKLSQELTSLLQAALEAEAAKPVVEDTPDVKNLKSKASSLMDERSALKERARVFIASGVKEGPELQEIAFKLAFDIRSELDSIFGRIQYYQVNGALPQSDAPAIQSIAGMVSRRNTLRTYLSRGGQPEKIEKWKAELFELDQKIKEFQHELQSQ